MKFIEYMELLNEWKSQPHLYLVDPNRVNELEMAHQTLEKIIHRYTPEAKIEINMNKFNDGSATITTETDELVVHNVQEFISIIQNASNFEIYPLNNGNIRIAVLFNHVMRLVK